MIKALCRRAIRRFAACYHYDTAYMQQLLDVSVGALLRFNTVNLLSGYRRGIPPAPWCAARIRAALAEDCGPCVQLTADMALEAGLPAPLLSAIIELDLQALPADVALAVEFTEAVLARDPGADELRERVRQQWGEPGLVSLAMTITGSRTYPALKYALGHGKACSLLSVGGHDVTARQLQRAATA